jgi:hypothetical protein
MRPQGDKKSASMILAGLEAYAADPQGVFDVRVLKGRLGQGERIWK